MGNTDWSIKGHVFAACNCAWGCPCQFMSLPTNGCCHATATVHIDVGHFGEVTLDGLNAVTVLAWPGAIHEGNGKAEMFIDERANPAQREALIRILSGEDTDEGATVFQVFSTTLTEVYEPQFAAISVQLDPETLTAEVSVDGKVTVSGAPLRNPITGAEHRAQIRLVDGFEYEVADVLSGTINADGNIALRTKDRHAHLAAIHMTQHGLVH